MHKKLIYILIFSTVFFAFSCSNRPKDVMNKREIRTFLYDLHVLEGAISSNYTITEREKAYYYHSLFLKHGITKEVFDSSIAYYTRDPKMFERIYLRVNKDIEVLQDDVIAGKYEKYIPDSIRLRPSELDMWYLDSCFLVSSDTLHDELEFSVSNLELLTRDIYNLFFRMRVHAKDTVDTAYTKLRIHYADGVVDSLSHSIIKDSLLKRYRFKFHAVRNYEIDSLSGVFYSQKENVDTFNISIDSISLVRKYIPYYQDSLKLQLDTVEKIIQDSSLIIKKDSIQKDSVVLKDKTIQKQ